MQFLGHLKEALLHLVFPHTCAGCGTDVLDESQALCLRCVTELPATHFEHFAGNPVEKRFWGRLPLQKAAALYYFTKESSMQRLMHAFKYRSHKRLGLYLGQLMGQALHHSGRFADIDCLVPLPLFAAKEKSRGYNQAAVLCEGIHTYLDLPLQTRAVARIEATESQTKKNRVDRWQNMEGRFAVVQPHLLEGHHVLLVDDVVTTGATLEACGRAILEVPGTRLSVVTLCYASGS